MEHRLIPEFILRQIEEARFTGHFHAVCVFVDLSDFTPFTATMMAYGAEGVDAIAAVLSALFEPLLKIIYDHDGYVAVFAGDAFKAIFPTSDPSSYLRALSAAWQIHQFITKQPHQATRFGTFHFALKVSIVAGNVEWGIWQADLSSTLTINQQRAAYFFGGEALDACLQVDAAGQAGTLLFTEAVYTQLPQSLITIERRAPYYQLLAVDDSLLMAPAPSSATTTNPNDPAVTQFFPAALLQQQNIGEFRQVVSVFINLQQLPIGSVATTFQQTLFHLLAQYGGYLSLVGRIGNGDVGCTLVLFWGAPTSYENNLRRALCFLLDLRNATTIRLRAGVTQNLVYAGFVGSARYQSYTCYGAYVNLAARQMAQAAWGEILLDAATAHQAQPGFRVIEQGRYLLKGFAEAQQLFRLDQEMPTIQAAYSTPMVGRQQALDQLWQAVQPLFQGNFGGIVTITGEAGIGKSRLVYELKQRIRLFAEFYPSKLNYAPAPPTRRVVWFTYQIDEIQQQPLAPFRHILRAYFQQATTNSEAANKRCFTEKLDALIAATLDPSLAAELERIRPFLGALIGLQWADSRYQQVEPQLRFANTLDALKSLFKALSLCQPLILHLDDVHWLDLESSLFLEKLTSHVDDYPFLVLLTMRSPNAMMSGQESKRVTPELRTTRQSTIYLSHLQRHELQTLAIYWLEGAVTAAVVDLLMERAAGNPFFAEQILRYLQEHELLEWSDQGWRPAQNAEALLRLHALPLPATVHMILTARLDRLPQTVKEIVQTAAVLGQTFDLRLLSHMCSGATNLSELLTIAEEAGIWSVSEFMDYRFRHVLLRDTAYHMQLPTKQRALHRRAAAAIVEIYAQTLPAHYAELVYHFRQGEDAVNERRYAIEAGKHAAEQYENEDAVAYFSRALELTEQDAWIERYALLLQRESLYNLLGQRSAQAQDLAELHKVAEAWQDENARQEVLLRQTYYLRVIGDYEAALRVVQRVLARATAQRNQVFQTRAYHAWGRLLLQQGNAQAAHSQLEHALLLARLTHNRLQEAESLYDLGLVHSTQSHYALAATYYGEALTHYQSLGNQQGEINCLLMFGVITNEQGDYSTAHHYYQQAMTRCRAIGWRHAEAYSVTNLGNNYFDFGNYEAALICHQRALELCRMIDDFEGEAISLDTLGLIWQNLGNATQAHIHFERALVIQRQIGDRHSEGFTLTHLGYTLHARGELAAASSHFQQAYTLRMTLHEESHAVDSLAGLAFTALTQKDFTTATALAERCLTWLQTQGADGIEFPILVYLICYQVLATTSMTTAFTQAVVLHDGYKLLQARSAKIQDPTLRRQFLENVWFNRELLTYWQEHFQCSNSVKTTEQRECGT